MDTIEERVKRGTDLLDSKFPIWRMRVNPTQLDMGSPIDGVLEQLFPGSGYFSGLAQLGLRPDDGYEYGLDIEPDTDDDLAEWAELTETWKHIMETTVLIQNK